MSTYQQSATALEAAMEEAAAFSKRQHEAGRAGRGVELLDGLLTAAADFGAEADKLPAAPPWEEITFRLLARFPIKRDPDPLVARIRAHLDQPHMQARAALPVQERRALLTINSHSLTPNEPLS